MTMMLMMMMIKIRVMIIVMMMISILPKSEFFTAFIIINNFGNPYLLISQPTSA
jgi:hypothetical protein